MSERATILEAVSIIQDAMLVLARYGARERNPDEEAWSVYSHCINFISRLKVTTHDHAVGE